MGNGFSKPNELCDLSIAAGCGKVKLTVQQQVILGILAGAYIAMGGVVSSVVSHSVTNVGLAKFAGGALFPIGLMLVVICGAELFTGNCLMIIPQLNKDIDTKSMLKNWVIVYACNFIGSFLVAFLVYNSGLFSLNSGKLGATVIKVASTKANLPFSAAFCSGILCNFLVCLAVWGASAAKDIISKILIIWFPIMTFVTCGFEHSVANMYFLLAGLFAKNNPAFVQGSGLSPDKIINNSGLISNLVPVTLGNIVGGVVFVGIAYYVVYKHIPAKVEINNNKVVNMK